MSSAAGFSSSSSSSSSSESGCSESGYSEWKVMPVFSSRCEPPPPPRPPPPPPPVPSAGGSVAGVAALWKPYDDASTSRVVGGGGVKRALAERDEGEAAAAPAPLPPPPSLPPPPPPPPAARAAKRKHLYTREVLDMWSWDRIRDELGTEEQCLSFSDARGLLLKEKRCSHHGTPMKLVKRGAVGAFRCYKGRDSRHTSKYHCRSAGTWFHRTQLDITKIFRLMYSYARNLDYFQTRIECSVRESGTAISEATISDWFNYCRETVVVVMRRTLEAERPKLGGPGRHVQIDESKFGRRKLNRGRRVEGHWVLGIVDDATNELRLEVCPGNDRTAEVLIPLIRKHVAPGTIIHTDFWKGYDCLPDYDGYVHRKVNHSDPNNPFLAPDGTHTNHIESQWRNLKRRFYEVNYSNVEKFEDFLIEYLWRQEGLNAHRDLFEELISAIGKIYKPSS